MRYDRAGLKAWSRMEHWDECLEKNGGLGKHSSKEGFDYLQRQYFSLVEKRIRYCEKLLKTYQDAFLYYVIAQLYDRTDLNKSPAYLYKRYTRFLARKALEFDPSSIPARELLDRANQWLEFLGGDEDYMPDIEIQFKDIEENKENENKC